MGYVWIGTRGGVCRYDGQSFIEYPIQNRDIRIIYEDQRGKIWLGTNGGGLCCLSDSTCYSAKHAPGLNYIVDIVQDSRDYYWLATNGGGVCQMDLRHPQPRFTNYSLKQGFGSKNVRTLLIAKDSSIWCGTTKGISCLLPAPAGKPRRIVNLGIKDGLPGEDIRALCQSRTGQIWCGSEIGLSFWSPQDSVFSPFPLMPHGTTCPINAIVEDYEGVLWIGTRSYGVFHLTWDVNSKTYRAQNFNTTSGLLNNDIHVIFEDREFNLWFGTMGNGISKLLRGGFVNYNQNNGLAFDNIFAIFQDHHGDLWFGSSGKGISILSGNAFHYLSTRNGLINDKIWNIRADRRQNIWIGSSGGVTRFVPSRRQFEHFRAANSPIKSGILHLCEDHFDRVWMASAASGIIVYDANSRPHPFYTFTIEDGVSNNAVHVIFETRDSTIWCGTETGACRTRNKKDLKQCVWEIIPFLNTTSVWCFFEDQNFNLWIGTNNYGLIRMSQDGRLDYYAEEAGLADKTIYFIQPDQFGNLWLGTNKGIDRLVFDGKSPFQVKHYDLQNGLANRELNANSSLLDREGNLWFGTVAGVSRFDPTTEHLNLTPPLVHIESIFTEKEAYHYPKECAFKHNENNLTLNYRGLSFRNEAKIVYQYFLEGLDNNWKEITTLTQVKYASLGPGSYRFWVKAANSDGIWSTQPAIVAFTISPAWWNTAWFRLLSVLVISLVVVGLHLNRVYYIKKMNQLLEQKVQERTLELERMLKKLRELEFQLFQSTKMATLGQLSAGIAHEINNPIAYIYNNTFIIKKNLQKIFEVLGVVYTSLREHPPTVTSTEQLQHLEQIISEVDLQLKKQVIEDAVTKNENGLERIQMIIESLKNFTRINNAELKMEALDNCIESALEILQPQIRGNIQIIKSYQALPPIQCYGNLLIQVFINLISNAIQAIQREGQIFIRTSVGQNEQVVEIEDTGCGIPAANLEKIFDPLFSTKELGHGMGLGLSICKGIIEKHHGTISVKSTVDKGSLFKIILPQNNAEERT